MGGLGEGGTEHRLGPFVSDSYFQGAPIGKKSVAKILSNQSYLIGSLASTLFSGVLYTREGYSGRKVLCALF